MRYLRYSLATLGGLVAIICLIVAPWVNRVHFQERVIAHIERLGGKVGFAIERSPSSAPLEPSWLQSSIGDKYFRKVQEIHLELRPVPNELLDRMAQLRSLEHLSLRDVKLTDESLRAIGRMHQLRSLRIGFNEITDDGLAHLAELKELVVLDLSLTKVTDAGLARLKPLGKLWRLELYGNEITDQGAEALSQMPGLAELDLGNTKITSQGTQPLSKLPDLIDLALDQIILGEGQELRINDEALPHLLACPKLQFLSIISLPISQSAIAELKRAKPGIVIQK